MMKFKKEREVKQYLSKRMEEIELELVLAIKMEQIKADLLLAKELQEKVELAIEQMNKELKKQQKNK